MPDPSITVSPERDLLILQRDVTLVDPHTNTDVRDRLSILGAIHEPLVRRAHEGTFEPCLATSWEAADAGRAWTFRLREGVLFHDGAGLTAEDVVASLERVRDPSMTGELGTGGVYQAYLEHASFRAVDALTVQVTLDAPLADFLDLLVDMPIVSRSILTHPGATAVGSGPFRLASRTDDLVSLERFKDHWGEDPGFDRVRWERESDPKRRAQRVFSGEADLAADVPWIHLEATSDCRLITAPSSVCTAFMFNLLEPSLSDPRVRRALNHALDVPGLIEDVMKGQAERLNGPLTRVHLGHDPDLQPYRHDPEYATALLREAGFADGFELELDVPEQLPDEAVELAEAMAGQFARIGVRTVIRRHADRAQYAEMVRAGGMRHAACFDSSPFSTFRVLWEKFHSGHRGPWWLGYTNEHVDALVDRARTTVETGQRQQLYREAYRLLSADAPWIFLYGTVLSWCAGPKLSGWQPQADGRIRIKAN